MMNRSLFKKLSTINYQAEKIVYLISKTLVDFEIMRGSR